LRMRGTDGACRHYAELGITLAIAAFRRHAGRQEASAMLGEFEIKAITSSQRRIAGSRRAPSRRSKRGHSVQSTPTPTPIDTGTAFTANKRVIFEESSPDCLTGPACTGRLESAAPASGDRFGQGCLDPTFAATASQSPRLNASLNSVTMNTASEHGGGSRPTRFERRSTLGHAPLDVLPGPAVQG
jgi:hypothetical protein